MMHLSDVSKVYEIGGHNIFALKNVSLSINEGEFIAIMGPSGSGKSTLLNVIGLLDTPDKGTFELYGKEISKYDENELSNLRSQLVGFIFQQYNLLKRTTAKDNVSLPLLYFQSKDSKSADDVLATVKLSDRMDHKSNELSGGQQQRVAIARSLINNPKILFADEPTGNLDSKSETEILEILKKLHKDGMTIVMVTHEEHISKIASRVIRMHDGEIISDTGSPKNLLVKNAEFHLEKSSEINFSFLVKNVRMAFTSIFTNKARSILSMLGILMGVAAVISMLAIGQGAQDSIAAQFSSLGTNILTVSPGAAHFGPMRVDAGKVTRLHISDAKAIRTEIKGVDAATSIVSGQIRTIYSSKNWSTSVTGTDKHYPAVNNLELALGRFFSEEEDRSRKRLAIIGLTVVQELFEKINPIGQYIKINNSRYQVIGVLKEKGSSGFRDEDDIIIIPLDTAMKRLLGETYLSRIQVRVAQGQSMQQVQSNISNLIIKRNKLSSDESDSFNIRNMSSIKEAFSQTAKILSYLLAVIAAISLFVGGIGIMNIMLVSVTERTREIGLRKAIGATQSAILIQFLIESVIISLSGGLAGICLGAVFAVLVSLILGWSAPVTISSILISTFFSASIGIIFGIWPARKAALLKPIDALRFE